MESTIIRCEPKELIRTLAIVHAKECNEIPREAQRYFELFVREKERRRRWKEVLDI